MKKKKQNKNGTKNSFGWLLRNTKKGKARFIVIAVSFIIAYFIFLYFTQFAFLFQKIDPSTIRVGSIAEKDIVVDRDIIYIDKKATELKKQAKKELVPPVFKVHDEITKQVLDEYDKFVSVFTEYQGNQPDTLFLQIQAVLPGIITRTELQKILEQKDPVETVQTIDSVLKHLMYTGIMREQTIHDIFIPGRIELWRWKDGRNEKADVEKNNIVTMESLPLAVKTYCAETNIPEQLIPLIQTVIGEFAQVNAFYDAGETDNNQKKVIRETQPVTKRIPAGEQILKKGFLITEDDKEKIEALGDFSVKVNVYSIVGSLLFLFILYALAFFLLRPPFSSIKINNTQLFILLSMFLFFLLIALINKNVVHVPDWLPFSVILPTAFISMLVSIIINPRISLYFTLIVALSLFVLTGLNTVAFLFSLSSGIVSILLLKNAEKRIDLIRATFFLSITDGIVLVVFSLVSGVQADMLPKLFGWGVLNGFACGILNIGILPILEHLLNLPTRFRLMELSDTNAPMLKKMLTIAPGTYSHSLNVANMAEAACKEIGANPLIARVGAFYHDIGKMDQAEYFIENQKDINKHDELKPSLSVAVIKSHVKIGIEKGKELKLPKAVVDIIAQHHGSGLISYFYSEALKNERNSKINREDYSYSEAVPASREAAVVMLADTVEAAVRTLKKPSIPKLEKFIWDLFMYKSKEKQLNASDITFRDLEAIKTIFVQILAGYFHARIEYPKSEEDQQ